MTIDPARLLTLAVRLARQAGDLAYRMRSEAASGSALQVDTKSTPTDVVTAADRAVERLVLSELRRERPHDAILGEETGQHDVTDREESRVRWIVDPIDGTVNYLYGIPQYAVSLAVEVDGEVVAGVVRNPVTGQEWTAIAGQGAWRDGTRLTGSRCTDLSQALVATGFGYDAQRRAYQGEVIARLLPKVRDIRRFGSASLDLCMTAEGIFDAYFEKGLKAWDLAAGGLIAKEAGLQVTGLRGQPAGPDMTLAAPAALHQGLHDLLVELDADGGP